MACLHKCSFNLLVFRCTDTSAYWVQTELVCTTQDDLRNFKMINIRKILCSCQRQEAAGTQTALCPFSEHSEGSRTQCHTRPTQPAVTILTLWVQCRPVLLNGPESNWSAGAESQTWSGGSGFMPSHRSRVCGVLGWLSSYQHMTDRYVTSASHSLKAAVLLLGLVCPYKC